MNKFSIILLTLFSISYGLVSGVEFSLEKSVVLVGENASETERYAARELQRAVEMMTGTKLPIAVKAEEGVGGFVIGTPKSSGLVSKELFETTHPEEIRVVKKGGVVTLAGPTPRAALYATYAFLEEVLGVRWLWPGESGEFIPKVERLKIPEVDLRQVPDIEHRGLVITWVRHSYDEETDKWMSRNRLNRATFNPALRIADELVQKRKEKGFLITLGGHNAVLPRALLEKHPEYVAEVGGERRQAAPNMRPPQLCWSNPDVAEAMAEQMKNWCVRYPFVEVISFIPADHGRHCECAPCAELGNVSEQWQVFSSRVITKVRETYPEMRFFSLAYMGYRDAPEKGTVAPFDSVGYAIYNGCYRHDPAEKDAVGDKPAEEIRKWRKAGAQMGLRGYEYILAKEPIFIPLVSWEVEQFRWAHQLEMNSYSSEVPPYGYPADRALHEQGWTTNRMNIYAAAKAAWNSKISPKELVRDWTQTIYGDGAAAMEEYYWMMEQAWRAVPGHITMFSHPAYTLAREVMTPELLAEAEGKIRSAQQSIAKATESPARKRGLEQVELEELMLANWKKFYQYQLNQQGEWEVGVVKAAGPLEAEETWQAAATLAKFEDKEGNLAPEQTTAQLLWNDEGLHMRITCEDPNAETIKTIYQEHDQKLYSDECVEIFLNPEGDSSGYMHLIVNAAGARYDARTEAGMNFDRSWNPEWRAEVKRGKGAWTINITLPFSSFGDTPVEGAVWKFALKRSRPKESGQPHSGWPDGSYHSPGAFGGIKFLTKPMAKAGSVVLLDSQGRGDGLKIEFLERDWEVAVVKDGASLARKLSTNPTGVVVRWMPGVRLSPSDWQGHILPYLRNGGRMVIGGSGRVPLRTWLPSEGAEVEWSGWGMDPIRVTSSYSDGAWMRHPHDLGSVIAMRTTPPSGFLPLDESWKILASCKMESGEEAAYLLQRAVGNGFLFLTSSGMGFGGGHEMFGHKNTKNAFKLLENLFILDEI